MRKITILSIFYFNLYGCAWFSTSSNQPPQVYKPTYIYGNTPMGVYMGNPYNLGEDMVGGGDIYMPNGEPMTEYQAQSGQSEQQFQYIQGQETLMHDHSQEEFRQYKQEQQLSESMEQQYTKQINQQNHQSTESSVIILPHM